MELNTFGGWSRGLPNCATLCVMSRSRGAAHAGEEEGERVGVRELRQNLSIYLARVKRGERLEVTEHGRPVALLSPLVTTTDPFERAIAQGRLSPPSADLQQLLRGRPPLAPLGGGRGLTEILLELRDDERP